MPFRTLVDEGNMRLVTQLCGEDGGAKPAQVTRMIARYRKSGSLQAAGYRRHRFPQRHTRADIELLATVDEAHDNSALRVRSVLRVLPVLFPCR
jgi:hypothetical protein